MPTLRRSILRTLLIAFAAVTGSTAPTAADEARNVAIFNEAYAIIGYNVSEYSSRPANWDSIGAKYRPQAAAARNEAELSRVINRMLDEFGPSQMGHYTWADPLYYQISEIFDRVYAWEPVKRVFASGEIRYPCIGITSQTINGRTFVSAVLDGLPAAKAGVLRGDEIINVDGRPFEPVRSFQNVGQRSVLKIRRTANGPVRDVVVVPESLNPRDMFVRAMNNSIRITQAGPFRIGYVHVWSSARVEYRELLEDKIFSGGLNAADALVLDLRGGLAGIVADMAELFGPVPHLEMVGAKRPGQREPLKDRRSDRKVEWKKPVVLLVNKETRSGMEILAYLFKRTGRGKVIGTRTAGVVEGFTIRFLDDGSLLQFPIATIEVDGHRLGRGVEPTIDVPLKLEYSAGRDPQLERAIEELIRTLGSDTQRQEAAAEPSNRTELQATQSNTTEAGNVAIFDQAWRTIANNVYEYRLRAVSWESIDEKYRSLARAARNKAELSAAINRMLTELHAGEIGHYTSADPRYYQIANLFGTTYEMEAANSPFASTEVRYPGIGIASRVINGKTFVTAVLDGLPAAGAGVLPGDEIISVNGKPYQPIASFQAVGQGAILTIRRTLNGPTQNLAVTPEALNPREMYTQAMLDSVHFVQTEPFKIGYVHIWSNGGYRYQRLLEDFLLSSDLGSSDALILDLRDGVAGIKPDMTEIFGLSPDVVEIHLDNLHKLVVRRRSPTPVEWKKPVVLLVNEETCCGQEILAYAFKQAGRGEVIGTRTAGVIEAFALKFLDDGSLLKWPVAPIEVDGALVEGGVEPTIEVPFKLEYSAGRDPQLERAIEELVRALGSGKQNSNRKAATESDDGSDLQTAYR